MSFWRDYVQEYLAGNFLKEELTSIEAKSTNSLLKLDSVEKIREMIEVLKFAAQLSEEAARDIVIQLGMAAKKDELTEFRFDNETPRLDFRRLPGPVLGG